MTNFKKYINKIENQDFKEFTKYLDEDEFIKLEYHFNNYAKQLSIQGVSQRSELLKVEDRDVPFDDWLNKYFNKAEVQLTYKSKHNGTDTIERILIKQYKRAYNL